MTTDTPGQAKTGRYRFDYLFADDPNTTMPELRERHGQTVTIIRPLDPATEYDPEGDDMYRIKFPDGHEIDAWGFELTEGATA